MQGKVAFKLFAKMAGAYPHSCSMKQLQIFLLPTESETTTLEGYPFYIPGWMRHHMEKSFLFKETTARSGASILRSKNFDPATTAATHTFKPVLRRGSTATTFQIPKQKFGFIKRVDKG